jgi:hypothetical protein
MRCREFERLWMTGSPAELPPGARAHLAHCPACAVIARTDASTAAHLRRLSAALPAPDLQTGRIAIRQAIAEPSPPPRRSIRPRSAAPVVATLTAVLMVALFLFRSLDRPPRARTPLAAAVPDGGHGHQRGSVAPTLHSGLANDGARAERSPGLLPGFSPNLRSEATKHSAPATTAAAQALPEDDLITLNQGRPGDARPFAPFAPLPVTAAPAMLPERAPGSMVLDDLLNLNPIHLAAADASGVGAAAALLAAEAPATDARLQKKVSLHACSQRLETVLEGLARVTGVGLVAHGEVADESVSVWAEDRPLMEVMRDLRHLHGYYWSRSKRGKEYVYSLWQDAQSRAREEAELQRRVLEQQREFEASVWKHVRALDASDAELKRLGQEDPLLVAQMTNAATRGALRLFASLSPDQQARLLKGQTPSALERSDTDVLVFPRAGRPGETYREPPEESGARTAPRGDVVTLPASELTPRQRALLATFFPRTAAHIQQRAEYRLRTTSVTDTDAARQVQAVSAADLASATVTFFRWGDINYQGLSLRVDFRSDGRDWMLYNNFELPALSRQFNGDQLRRGEFRRWEQAQVEFHRLVGRDPKQRPTVELSAGKAATPPEPDAVLDAFVSISWPLPPERDPSYMLDGHELLALLSRDLHRPLVMDGLPKWLAKKPGEGLVFRVEKRPLRELLQRLFPGWKCHSDGGTLFLEQPDRIRWRLNQTPPAIRDFLARRRGAATLDDMVLLARSLTPGQVSQLRPFFSPEAREEILAVQELLQIYGEMAPTQRSALSQGVAFSRMTPPQQALFLAFAQRQRPFVERWRFQAGALRMEVAADTGGRPATPSGPAERVTFIVQFEEADTQVFTLDLSPAQRGDHDSAADLVGKPFPFPSSWRAISTAGFIDRTPVLADRRLRGKPLVVVLSQPFAQPYYGLQPPPSLRDRGRPLAERLQDTGLLVIDAIYGPQMEPGEAGTASLPPNLLRLRDAGGQTLTVWRGMIGLPQIRHSPTVMLVDRDEIVRQVFEWPAAWDVEAIERAAREMAAPPR